MISRIVFLAMPLYFFFLLSASALEPPVDVPIGWIGPMTGNAAVLGVDSAPAAEMVFDRVNTSGEISGRRIRFMAEDDQYVSQKTLAAYNKLVHQSGAKALIVLTYGGIFALAPRAQADGVVLIDPLDCDEAIGSLPENVVCIAKTTEDLGYRMAELVRDSHRLPTAVLYFDGDPFMGTVAKAMESRLKNSPGALAYMETYNDATQDFRAYLTKVKGAGVKSLTFMGYDTTGLAMKQARELGITAPFYAVAGTMQGPGFRDLAKGAAEGVIGPVWVAPKSPRYEAFLSDFEKKIGRKPFMDLCTVPTYDVAEILVDAIKNGAFDDANGSIDVQKLKAHLYGLKNYDGISGKITMSPDGVTRGLPISTVSYKEGHLIPLN